MPCQRRDCGHTATESPHLTTLPTASPRPAVLILGANGRLGCAAAQAFDAAGWRVLAQTRRDAVRGMPVRAELLRAAITETDALVAALAGPADAAPGVRVVVHAVNPAYTRWDAEALPALQAGLRVAQRAQAHFMLPGNVYNYGEAMPQQLREHTPFSPSTAKGALRVEMEVQTAQAARAGGFSACVVRAGDFLGPGSGTWLDLVIAKSLRSGKLVYPGPLDLPHAWAYLPDLAQAFVLVASQAVQPTFQTWHFEGHTFTGTQLLRAIEQAAQAQGLRPAAGFRIGRMPWGLIAAVGRVYPLWRELARMSYLWRVPHALDGRRLQSLAGRVPLSTPLPTALHECFRSLGLETH